MKTEHSYGWKREPKDKRDFKPMFMPTMALPDKVDLRDWNSAVLDQDGLGACGGFGYSVGIRESMLNKHGHVFERLSPMYAYYYARVIENSVGIDSGCYIRDLFKVGAKQGTTLEALYPYNPDLFREAPNTQANRAAERYKITSYHRLTGLTDIKIHLAKGYSCVFGFVVRESFESLAVARTGHMPMPKWNEKRLGGHAVFCCGYEDDYTWPGGGYLIIKNSWSPNWGDKGYFYMPYAYLKGWFNLNVSDIWTAES